MISGDPPHLPFWPTPGRLAFDQRYYKVMRGDDA